MFVGNRSPGEKKTFDCDYDCDFGFDGNGQRSRSWSGGKNDLGVSKENFVIREAFRHLRLRLRRRRSEGYILVVDAWVGNVDVEVGSRSGSNERLMWSLRLFQGEIDEWGRRSCSLVMEQMEVAVEQEQYRSCFDT